MSGSARAAKRTSQTSYFPRCAFSSAVTWKRLAENKPLERTTMNNCHSDALVFFGATGDLAYKKIFPSLQAMVQRGTLDVPVVCVAKSGWNIAQLRARVQDSLEKHGGLDPAAYDKLSGLLRYIDGDYAEMDTFHAIRRE